MSEYLKRYKAISKKKEDAADKLGDILEDLCCSDYDSPSNIREIRRAAWKDYRKVENQCIEDYKKLEQLRQNSEEEG